MPPVPDGPNVILLVFVPVEAADRRTGRFVRFAEGATEEIEVYKVGLGASQLQRVHHRMLDLPPAHRVPSRHFHRSQNERCHQPLGICRRDRVEIKLSNRCALWHRAGIKNYDRF